MWNWEWCSLAGTDVADGGVMLLGLAEQRMGIADWLDAEITDRRDPARVVHALSDILRAPF